MADKLGATGKFPQGKLNSSDKGELALVIGIHEQTIIMDFGTSVTWLGFDAKSAREIGQALIDKANSL